MNPKFADPNQDSQAKIQALESELFEKNQRLSDLEKELRIQKEQHLLFSQDADIQIFEQLIAELAPMLIQWKTQARLAAAENSKVGVNDVLRVFSQLEKTLSKKGVAFTGEIGQPTAYDPDQHLLLGSNQSIAPDDPVIIKVCGVSLGDKIIRKIGVDAMIEVPF